MQRRQPEESDNYHCHTVKHTLHFGSLLHLASTPHRPQPGKLGRFSYGVDPQVFVLIPANGGIAAARKAA